jgi:hypothetical protein
MGRRRDGIDSPLRLLEHRAQHIDTALVEASRDVGSVRARRLSLALKDPAIVTDAIRRLPAGSARMSGAASRAIYNF